MDKFQYRQISSKSPLSHYVVARYCSCCSERKQQGNIHCLRGNATELEGLAVWDFAIIIFDALRGKEIHSAVCVTTYLCHL